MRAVENTEQLYWESVAINYDNKILSPLFVQENNPLLDYVNNLQGNGLIVADVGCGTGSFIEKLASNDRIKKIYGIDYSYKMIEIATKRCKNFKNVEFLKIDMKNLQPLRKKLEHERSDINIIFSINSILPRDIRDKRKMLSEIAATLKPGNKFVAVLPSFDTVIYLKGLTFEDYKEKRNNEIVRFRDYLKIFCYLKFWLKMHHSDRMYLLKFWNWNKKETGAMLETWKYFYHDRKMNWAKRQYADDKVIVQTFFHEKNIKTDLKDVGLELLGLPKKLHYPWSYAKDRGYSYFPDKEEIWDWFVEANKIEKPSKIESRHDLSGENVNGR